MTQRKTPRGLPPPSDVTAHRIGAVVYPGPDLDALTLEARRRIAVALREMADALERDPSALVSWCLTRGPVLRRERGLEVEHFVMKFGAAEATVTIEGPRR